MAEETDGHATSFRGICLRAGSNFKIWDLGAFLPYFCDSHPSPLLLSVCLQHAFEESGAWPVEDWKKTHKWREDESGRLTGGR